MQYLKRINVVIFEAHYCKTSDITFLTKISNGKMEVINFQFGKSELKDFDLNEVNTEALIEEV